MKKGRNRRHFLLFTCFIFLGISSALAQKQVVSGVVTDPSLGSPIHGVSVMVKDSLTLTTTDTEGRYSILVKPTDVLIFSLSGYISVELPVGNNTRLDVALEEDIQSLAELMDVVLVGYGELKRTDLSSAQVSLDAKQIDQTLNTTVEQALQGRAAGVYVVQNTGQPDGSVSVNIRGVNSVNGTNDPLYVIDGIQINSGGAFGSNGSVSPLAGLNPADIETIEVLQGPSATAIYGSRATNGVILITTRRGKQGDLSIRYGFQYGIQDTPKRLPVLNQQQYAQFTNELRTSTGGTIPEEFQDLSLLGKGTDWQRELFATAPLVNHHLSISGGKEETQFYLSGDYFKQDGIISGAGFDRGSIRLNIDNQTRSWLKLNLNLNVNQTDDKLTAQNENVIVNTLAIAPNIAVRNLDGSWGGADNTNGSSVQYTPYNPVAIANLIQDKYKRRQLLAGVGAAVNITKSLTFKTSLNTNIGTASTTYFVPTFAVGQQSNNIASLTITEANTTYWSWNQLLQYDKSIDDHTLGVMVSHEAQYGLAKNVSSGRMGFITTNILDLNAGNGSESSNSSAQSDWAMESYFSRVNYTFKNKYIVQAAMRADGSSNFGRDHRWGLFPSGSVAWRISQESFMKSLAAVNELKLRAEVGVTGNQGNGGVYSELIPITTPWGTGFVTGQYGNHNLKWEQTTTYNVGFNLGLMQDHIHVEGDFYTKKTNNLIMKSQLPDYLGTNGTGSIASPTENISALENKGYSITVSTVNLDRNDFVWHTNFNISGFKTKVTRLYSESAIIDRTAWYMNSFTQRSLVGKAPWQFYGYQEEGLFQSVDEINASALPVNSDGKELTVGQYGVWVGDTKYKDVNQDGVIDERDRTYIGNPWPKFFFGLTNTFNYKGFDLSVLLTGSYGNDIYNYMRYANSGPNNVNLGMNVFDETMRYAQVSTDAQGNPYLLNPGTQQSRLIGTLNGNNTRISSRFVEDGSYLRLKNVQVGYTLPSSVLSKQNLVKDIHITIGAQNLATLTGYKGYDPEVGSYVGKSMVAGNQLVGVDYGRYPLTPVYTFSIHVEL
jgi:TonB-dependent starch-binding outer membrane protein SusC